MRIRQITCIFARESHEFFRDKILRVIAFAMPLSIMLIFGYGLALDVENVPMAIVDETTLQHHENFHTSLSKTNSTLISKGFYLRLVQLRTVFYQAD